SGAGSGGARDQAVDRLPAGAHLPPARRRRRHGADGAASRQEAHAGGAPAADGFARGSLMSNWLGLPPVASAHGASIDHVISLVHVLMFIMFIGWGALFAYMLVRFRRKRQPQADYA